MYTFRACAWTRSIRPPRAASRGSWSLPIVIAILLMAVVPTHAAMIAPGTWQLALGEVNPVGGSVSRLHYFPLCQCVLHRQRHYAGDLRRHEQSIRRLHVYLSSDRQRGQRRRHRAHQRPGLHRFLPPTSATYQAAGRVLRRQRRSIKAQPARSGIQLRPAAARFCVCCLRVRSARCWSCRPTPSHSCPAS